jgi:hypothetical protein
MKRIRFHPDAFEEARDAAAYYKNVRDGLGAEFRLELARAIARIQETPLLYATENDGIRACSLYRFPYSIYYEVHSDWLWVAAVGHHRRKPGYWARRRPT